MWFVKDGKLSVPLPHLGSFKIAKENKRRQNYILLADGSLSQYSHEQE